MFDRDPRRLAVWAAGALILVLLSAWYLARSRPAADAAPPPAPAAIAVQGETKTGQVTVDVAGAVERPGVYRLPASARVEDALERAGGGSRRADLSQVNRAAKLEDGRQILVPERAPKVAAATSGASGGAGQAADSGPVNLNTATLEQLQTLDGVGPATAQKIFDYRTEHNGFGSVDELDQVPGIGEKRLAALRERVRV
ncbi:MAG TPA: ComEA family DNA-binding protein [Solirubrobacter sp.]|nr:ComEA family DNA-binding protein [Solirubrobacter sp.]